MLWIAFIFQYLWDTQQHPLNFIVLISCCELLSFFSIFGIHNNLTSVMDFAIGVVNCFHFSVSLGYTTTKYPSFYLLFLLWIAFIFQYLWDTQQQYKWANSYKCCCELLSFFSIFGIHNNFFSLIFLHQSVVNCFHFSVSLGYTTTSLVWLCFAYMLWIAFIFQYLWDTQQHNQSSAEYWISCELLSFFSIFGIHNNFRFFYYYFSFVVNCFHFSVSLGYTTTFNRRTMSVSLLWIAFIFQYLWDTQQH